MTNIITVWPNSNKEYFDELLLKIKSGLNYFDSAYSSTAIDYYRQRAEDNAWRIKDCSFILAQETRPFFACISFLQSKDNSSKLSVFEKPSLFIESGLCYSSRAIKKRIASTLEEYFLASRCQISATDLLLQGKLTYSFEYLIKTQNCSPVINWSRFINLAHNEKDLRQDIRKSFLSLINWGLRELSVTIYDKENITWDIISAIQMLHFSESGRQTRSTLTWHKQYIAITKGEAFCVLGKYYDEIVSAGYFLLSDRHCYYGVSASRRDMFEKPLFHALMWEAICYAKKKGAIMFELGTDHPLNDSVSQKEFQIAKFKSGFGGYLKPSLNVTFDVNPNL